MTRNISAKLFPIGLMGLLFGLSFWLDQVSTLSTQGRALDPEKPEYIVDDASARRFDEQGYLHEILTAKRTWQLPKSDIIYTQQPKFDLFEAGINKYHLEGDVAEYNTETKVIYFNKTVHMTKMADEKTSAATIDTTQLTANTITQTVETKTKVDFRYGESYGSAVGFNYNHKTGVLNLKSRVSATYEVTQKP